MQKPQDVQGVSLPKKATFQIAEKDGWRAINGPDAGTVTPYTEQERRDIQRLLDREASLFMNGECSGAPPKGFMSSAKP